MSGHLPDGFSEVPSGSDWFGYTTDTKGIAKRYRLSADDYHRMLEEQDGRCAICRRHPTSVGPLFVDHDHDHPEKRVRGLLCSGCNLGLGHFKDDPYLLWDARGYLLARGSAATRHIEHLEREARNPEMATGTHELELHFLDGRVAIGAAPANQPFGDGHTFEKYGHEWRISERKPLPAESGPCAQYIVCYEMPI
jgi:hypothetical protein